MSAIETITITNAKTQSFSDSGGCFDGLTADQINAALAGADAIGLEIIERKLDRKGHTDGFTELFNLTVKHLKRIGEYPEILGAHLMISQTLDLVLDDDTQVFKCVACRGKNEVNGQTHVLTKQGVWRKCRRCGGYGNRKRNDTDRAAVVKVSKSTYSRHYKPLYDAIKDYMDRMLGFHESRAIRHFIANLEP